MDKFRTRNEFAESLGLSTRSLERKLIALQIELPKGLLSPKDQLMIREILGFID
jgi:transcriptional antiterminator